MTTLAQAPLTEVQRALRDYLTEGGSVLTVAVVLLVIAGVVVLAYLLTRRQRRTQNPPVLNDPQLLFDSLLSKLELTDNQRALLHTFARENDPEQPALLLVSAHRFDQHLGARGSSALSPGDGEALTQIRDVLFPKAPN